MTHPRSGLCHDIDAGACAVAVGDARLRAPHVASGLVLCLFDGADIAGLAHVLATVGEPPPGLARPGLFIDGALPALIALMRESGAGPALSAVLIGAAGRPSMLPTFAARTLQRAHAMLADAAIVVVDEFTGGSHVRSVDLDGRGALEVTSLGQRVALSLHRSHPSHLRRA